MARPLKRKNRTPSNKNFQICLHAKGLGEVHRSEELKPSWVGSCMEKKDALRRNLEGSIE